MSCKKKCNETPDFTKKVYLTMTAPLFLLTAASSSSHHSLDTVHLPCKAAVIASKLAERSPPTGTVAWTLSCRSSGSTSSCNHIIKFLLYRNRRANFYLDKFHVRSESGWTSKVHLPVELVAYQQHNVSILQSSAARRANALRVQVGDDALGQRSGQHW
jgi:hypothetical protein